VRLRFHRTILFARLINDIYIKYMQLTFPDLYREGGDAVDGRTSNLLVSDQVLMFVDGPRHEDTKNTRYGGVRYLCISGGHPRLRDEERLARLMVVMTGWKKSSHAAALEKYAVASIVEYIWKKNIRGEVH
jgi:hypothetical protein